MGKNVKYLLFLPMIFLISSCLTHEAMYYSSHTVLPDVNVEMKIPGYWISQNPAPDKVIMNENSIKEFNEKIVNAFLYVKNLENLDASYDPVKFKTDQSKYFNALIKSKLYFNDGMRVNKDFYTEISKNLNLDNMESEIKYGFLTKTSDFRGIPTNVQANDVRMELFFDTFQSSSLNAGTPVAVLHKSLDGKWVYVSGRIVSGWIPESNVAYCSKEKFISIINSKFVVVTSTKTGLFLDGQMTKFYDFARMGVVFYLPEELSNGKIKVFFPVRNEIGELIDSFIFLEKKDMNYGFLTYTPRTIIEQAFKSLNSPYGWGGMFGEQDCSQFLCEIYATAGIYIPRNSGNQALIGNIITEINNKTGEKDKIRYIKEKGIQGITFLRMPGHITLYLGYDENNIYVIHSTWGYNERYNYRDVVRLVNKVTVSTLKLGEGSKKGSLIKRINKVTVIN